MTTNIQFCSEQKMLNDKLENQTLKQLFLLEEEFREHYALVKNEMKLQMELVQRMWSLSQRYTILETSGPCCRYPEIYTGPAEDNLLHEFTDKLNLIRNSNCLINTSIKKLRKSCNIFEKLCAQLDIKSTSPLLKGDAYHKPIFYFIEFIGDLFKYFHAWLLKLRYSSHQFDPSSIESIEDYKEQIAISEDFEEYLYVGLTYCKCLRPKAEC